MSSKRRLGNLRSRLSIAARSVSPAWIVTAVLLLYILQSRCPLPMEDNETVGEEAHALARLHSSSTKDTVSRRLYATNNTRTSGEIGNKFCILQPTLSAGKRTWTAKDAREHIALRAFMRTFVATVTPAERVNFEFAIYYGHDSDDKVFGNPRLRAEFVKKGREMLDAAGFDESNVKMLFSPMYGLHGRINAIWNFLAKDAYYDGCDYFFLSNDDMVFFTPGWVTRATDSLAGVGSRYPHKRPCKYLGIVRFKDEWASWATFTFHVSTRLHMEIFGGVYYPVPYYAAHNDYWIHYVYRGFDASKYRGEVKVRNRVDNVDYALAHQKDKKRIAPARYTYDKLGDVRKYINEGRARLAHWIAKNKGTEFCLPPL